MKNMEPRGLSIRGLVMRFSNVLGEQINQKHEPTENRNRADSDE